MRVNNIFLALALCVSMASNLCSVPAGLQGDLVVPFDCGIGSNGRVPSWFSDRTAHFCIYGPRRIELVVYAQFFPTTLTEYREARAEALNKFLRERIDCEPFCPTKITIYNPPHCLMEFLDRFYRLVLEYLDLDGVPCLVATHPRKLNTRPAVVPAFYQFQGPPGRETFSQWLVLNGRPPLLVFRGLVASLQAPMIAALSAQQAPGQGSGSVGLAERGNNQYLCCFFAAQGNCNRPSCTFRHEPDDGKTPCGFLAECECGHADRAPFCCDRFRRTQKRCFSDRTGRGKCKFRHDKGRGICSKRFRTGGCSVHPGPNAAAPNPSSRVAGPPS